MQPFADESASSYAMSFDKNWDLVDDCKAVPWSTQFSMFRETDYKRCVCTNWSTDVDACLAGAHQVSEPEVD